jgi:hypothetical protein
MGGNGSATAGVGHGGTSCPAGRRGKIASMREYIGRMGENGS